MKRNWKFSRPIICSLQCALAVALIVVGRGPVCEFVEAVWPCVAPLLGLALLLYMIGVPVWLLATAKDVEDVDWRGRS